MINEKMIQLVIEGLSTDSFETWCQVVLNQVKDSSFEPTGGMHDGGQDGFFRSAKEDDIDHYVQISKEKNVKGKIKKTINDIQKSRKLGKLTYVTSQEVNNRDFMEAELKKEFGVHVEIHDLKWLVVQAQTYENIRKDLYSHGKGIIDEISEASEITEPHMGYSSRLNVVAYLEMHVQSMIDNENFYDICLDTIIYNELVGTDPERGIFMTAEEVEAVISSEHSNVIAKAKHTVKNRLDFLSSKENSPRVRCHEGSKYALPHEVRSTLKEESEKIEDTKNRFLLSIKNRYNSLFSEYEDDLRKKVISCVYQAFEGVFEKQAMSFAASFSKENIDNTDIKVYENIYEIVSRMEIDDKNTLHSIIEKSTQIFRNVCNASNDIELEYINILLKFYVISFAMDANEDVKGYFSDVARNLKIYIGADVIVRCLSENLLQDSNRGMTNVLDLARSMGVELNVTSQVIREVFNHIKNSTRVFRTDIEFWHHLAELNHIVHIDKILIRAFFHARIELDQHVRQPRNWSNYLDDFGRASWYEGERDNSSKDNENFELFASFLIDKYSLKFCDIDKDISEIDEAIVGDVSNKLLEKRHEYSDFYRILAENDANMGLFVNRERVKNNEGISSSLYGYNTWWLTEETKILHALRECGQNDNVIMHPRFLINHLVIDPNFIRRSSHELTKIAPTSLGLKITDRCSDAAMKKFVDKLRDLSGLDRATQRARIREATNELKSRGYPSVTAEN